MKRVKSASGSGTRRDSGPTGVEKAPHALQSAAEPWVEAPRQICSFVLAILDGQHGGAGPRSARLGAARRTGWRIWRRSATHHKGARRCAPAPTSGSRRSREGINISSVKHLIKTLFGTPPSAKMKSPQDFTNERPSGAPRGGCAP